jgi:propanol-preferring alcohol dehydrogenase
MSRAVVFDGVGAPLRMIERPVPRPGPGELLLKVLACGVCRTDLHLLDGELPIAAPPRVLGHQIVGEVVGDGGRIVGVPWLAWTCGTCDRCRSGKENLCPDARFTGRDRDGGFADHVVVDERFCAPVPAGYPPTQAAPLLCAGVIGHRALRLAGPVRRLGIYGFGAAGHVLVQVAVAQGCEVLAFTREGDDGAQALARELGAVWAGPSTEQPDVGLDAAIIFAPDGGLVPIALRAVAPGGVVVCGGIHMSDIPSFPYADLWGERVVRSVANLTRDDLIEFLPLAASIPVRTHVTEYGLQDAERALDDLRAGRLTGAAVVVP